jgi:5-methylcytosine-specific restriction protein B
VVASNDTWIERTGVRLRGVAQYLRDHGGTASKRDIAASIEKLLPPNQNESSLRQNGQTVWLNDVLWQTTNLVKAGWMTKDGAGIWSITQAGIAALDEFPDGAGFHRESLRRFNAWRRTRDEAQRRRAWLVRGSSVQGVNVVLEWLTAGFCSLAASQLRKVDSGITPGDLEHAVREDYEHLGQYDLKAKVDEILAFVTKMDPGDIVLTTSGEDVYVGDLAGPWTYQVSEGGRSNLRRAVEWRNSDSPLVFTELPAPVQAQLKSGGTLLDLTAIADVLDGLTSSGEVVIEIDDEPRASRHEHLAAPGQDLASELFVDLDWLREVRDLLDERKQMVFYGPPGTGKTFIARKLATDLVGAEQVKLVQFHPAYTYEDFFEGYRPAAESTGGTIRFQLKPGPLRQLVTRAREHTDQAFVLIIDEINRANLAKVFGELYFLLEYRDEAVDLLYSSDEGFNLPRNLYLIGTMNTADRSIALVDSAMRRRFSFVELSPDTEPTRSVLRRWSSAHGLGTVAPDLLERLNERIEDPDFRIGPSYFMTSTLPDAHSRERLERIWRTSILPLLQEHHYGEWESVRRRYQLKSLLPYHPEGSPELSVESLGSGEPELDLLGSASGELDKGQAEET